MPTISHRRALHTSSLRKRKDRDRKILEGLGPRATVRSIPLHLHAFGAAAHRPDRPLCGSVRAAILLVRLAAEQSIDAGELVQPFLDLGLLLLEKLDLLQALLAAQTQGLGIRVALFGSDHLADLTERETQLLPLENQCEPRAIAFRVEPVHPLAVGRDQSLVLVKAKRSQRHSELTGELADGECGLVARLASFVGLSSPHTYDGGFHVAGIVHF